MTTTPINGSVISLLRLSVCITWPVYWTAIGGSSNHMILSIISLINEKWLNSNNNRSKPKFRRLLWDIFIQCFIYFIPTFGWNIFVCSPEFKNRSPVYCSVVIYVQLLFILQQPFFLILKLIFISSNISGFD